jgi:hypothetical protein
LGDGLILFFISIRILLIIIYRSDLHFAIRITVYMLSFKQRLRLNLKVALFLEVFNRREKMKRDFERFNFFFFFFLRVHTREGERDSNSDVIIHSPTHLPSSHFPFSMGPTWDPSPPQERGDGGENAKKYFPI